MIALKLRLIREQNRIYTFLLKLLNFIRPNGPKVFIFHDILDDISKVESQFAITESSFKKFIAYQLSQGNHPNIFEELSDIILNKKKAQNNSFIVTFDDANESVYTKAYPFLQSHNIPFIVFITEALIGKQNYLNLEQIKILANDSLCTIGSHACHHVMFRNLSVEQTEDELKESKLFLEKLTDKHVDCFAFPYGRIIECSCKNIELLKKSEFKFAFSAISGNLNQSWLSSKFFLPRINVDEKLVDNLVPANSKKE